MNLMQFYRTFNKGNLQKIYKDCIGQRYEQGTICYGTGIELIKRLSSKHDVDGSENVI